MGNIDPRDLEELDKSFRLAKPRLKTDNLDLKQMHKAVNFGIPKIDNEDEINKDIETKQKSVNVKIDSPKIKITIKPTKENTQKIIQKPQIKIQENNDFSSTSISFIPYGTNLLNISQAIEQLKIDQKSFKIIQDNYLSAEQLKYIIEKINKVSDIDEKEKEKLINFYQNIITHKEKIITQRQKANIILEKIKNENFRTHLSEEIQRMFRDSGDLYIYYKNFNLIDDNIKKFFLNRITNIDYYILKKIKDIIQFNQNDLFFRFEEVIEFSQVLEARNIIMTHFHKQVEQLALQEKLEKDIKLQLEKVLELLLSIAKEYSKKGRYGKAIFKSTNLTNQIKQQYFKQIDNIIKPIASKLQKIKLDLETEDYVSIKLLKESIKDIDIKNIKSQCNSTYKTVISKEIK